MKDNFVEEYSIEELRTIKDTFYKELVDANSGKTTSIPFLIHTLPHSSILNPDELFQTITIGGSVFKTALFQNTPNGPHLLKEQESPIPVFSTADIFFSFLLSHLYPDVSHVAINFAFPVSPVIKEEVLDGILLHGTKEHLFEGLVGLPVGNALSDYICTYNQRRIVCTLANDTICLLLSASQPDTWLKTVTGVIGTGTNYALTLNAEKAVNLECGAFNKFRQTDTGKIIDAESNNPGTQLIEKEIAGAYLWKHYNATIQKYNLTLLLIESTGELSELAEDENSQASSIAQSLLIRSASLAASQIGGIVQFKKNLGLKEPLHFIIEGSLFWKGWEYKKHVENYLKEIGMEQDVVFEPFSHRSIEGAVRLLIPK
ncbi:MAG: hypothetical protein Q7S61_04950 [bacterium]|nr:hypothetical protein [bacterium]